MPEVAFAELPPYVLFLSISKTSIWEFIDKFYAADKPANPEPIINTRFLFDLLKDLIEYEY